MEQAFRSYPYQLFTCVAPGLQTLTVLQHNEILLPFVRAPTFANLREVTIHLDDGLFLRDKSDSNAGWPEPSDPNNWGVGSPPAADDLAADPPFPALTRLRLVNPGTPMGVRLSLWPRVAPHVQTLEIIAEKQVPSQLMDHAPGPEDFRELRP
ncbi:uncharacterized protein BXZ73DRAFT_98962 [Epithele typhae]|uniref:uncharacterized protein n=1 Tax=Epithele typhae TaxID=378194 RepID=UPI002008C9EB|nr:uncharacterized protein BXZ73DRAFT_98962 [Epithele typhae]KAH9940531.1 hypothetical protein BXZ73DRAFT_98962 [Epithele typhae]